MRFRVGCAGIVAEDTFCGPIDKLPQAGLLVAVDKMPLKPGGCASNVAIGLAKQGVDVEIVCCVGSDLAAKFLLESYDHHGIGRTQVIINERLATSKTFILLVKGEDRRYLHLFGANAGFSAKDISRDWLKSLDVLYLGGLFVLPGLRCDELCDVFSFCRKEGIKTVLDVVIPQGSNPAALRQYEPVFGLVDYFLPNSDEATALTGYKGTADQIARLLELGVGTVIVTRGEQGAVAARAGDLWSCGSYTMECVDPSGAGDAFAAGVIASISEGRDIPALLQYASAVGASATRAVGATDGVMSSPEAEAFVSSHPLIIEHVRQDPQLGLAVRGGRVT